MYFIVFFFGIVWVLNINKYSSNFNCNECKYCILELKMEFSHKKPFSICFVHKSRKFSNFEPTLEYIMLRNFRTICPIFPKIVPKVAQNLKEKSHESSRCGKKFLWNYRAKSRGGGADSAPPPPPPALLGLKVLGKSVGLCKTTGIKGKDQLYTSFLVSVWRIICENFNPNGLILAEIWMKI